MLAFLRLIRITNLFIIALSLSLFYYLIIIPIHINTIGTTLLPFSNQEFALFVLSIVFIAAGGNIINDYFDFELDKKYKPERPLATGAFSLDTAIYLHAAFVFTGIALGFYVGWKNNYWKVGYIYVISALLLYLYSAYLKKIALVGNMVVALLSAFIFVLLGLFIAQRFIFLKGINFEVNFASYILLWQLAFYGSFAFLTSLTREIVKDIEDREGDEEFNINTLAVQYGDNVAKGIALFVMLILLGGVGYFMNTFLRTGAMKEFYYMLFAIVVPALIASGLLLMAKEKKQYSRVSLLLKVIMLLGILSIPAFYLFNKQ